MKIRIDDLLGPEIARLLQEHLDHMFEVSPPESVHALDIESLRAPEITFWTAWEGDDLLGCGALKELDESHGEVKSMRTQAEHRGCGVAKQLLERLLEEAKHRGYRSVSLETGSQDAFVPARKLYERYGFRECGPFGDYAPDPNSVFMTLELGSTRSRRADRRRRTP